MEFSLCELGECLLCDAQLYAGLVLTQVCRIRGLVSKQSFRPGEVLFREGSASTHLFVLRSGQVKLTVLAPDGREQIIGLEVPGQLLGTTTLERQLYPCTGEALTHSGVCKIACRDMLRVLEGNPRVCLRLIRLLNQNLRRARALIQMLGPKTAVERVASFILSLIPAGGKAETDLPLLLSRNEIASLLGLTVGSVSRVMADFRRRGIIHAPRGHIRILDYARLEQLANHTGASLAYYMRHAPERRTLRQGQA